MRKGLVLQEGGPLPGSESMLLSNTWKWIVWGDTCVDKARDFFGKGSLGRQHEGKETQENCSATWLTVSGFMVIGLVSGLSLVNHSDSGSFLVVHALLSQDGFHWGGFWKYGRTYGISFWSFLNSSSWGWLVSSGFLTRTSCYKITYTGEYHVAWPGWVVSVSVSPNTGIAFIGGPELLLYSRKLFWELLDFLKTNELK